MGISTKGRYSLTSLLYMALHSDADFLSTKQISEGTGISEGYLEQLFIPLRRREIIDAKRGPTGGYFINRPFNEISVLEVLREAENSMTAVSCTGSDGKTDCPVKLSCKSRRTWAELQEGINRCLKNISLQTIIDDYKSMRGPEYTI